PIHWFATSTLRSLARVPAGACPHLAPPTPDGRWDLAVVQGPGELGIIDTASNTVAATVPVGKLPHWIAIAADGRSAWIANDGSNDVSVVDLSTRAVTATIPVGNAPRKIAVQPMGAPRSAGPGAPVTAGRAQPKTVTIGGVAFTDHGTRDVTALRVVKMEADD